MIINLNNNEEEIKSRLQEFECKRDFDIENFLKYKAIEFEKLGKSRTFLLIDEDNESFQILGYFTIALKILEIPEEFSNQQIKKLDGFRAKQNGEKIQYIPTILLGQLGKNDSISESFSGRVLLDYVLSTILIGQKYLAGRIIMLECKDIPYLKDLYQEYGFDLLEKDYSSNDLLTYFRILRENEIIY